MLIPGTHFSLSKTKPNYQWIDCDSNLPIPGANQQNFSPAKDGNYKVILSVGNCNQEDSSVCMAFNKVGLNKLNPNSLEIYPNPVNDNLNIRISDPKILIQSIQIISSMGQTVWKSNHIENQNLSFLLPKGMYLIKFHTNGGIVIKKVIK